MYISRGLGSATPGASALIESLAPSYGVPTSLALAVANKESGFNQSAVGSSGEVGVFQLMAGTASDLGVSDRTDLSQNVNGGLKLLSQMYQKFGNWSDALIAYNAGASRVSNPPASSVKYASSVLAAAGIDSSSSSDSLASSSSSDTSGQSVLGIDLSALTDSSTGLSLTAWAAIGIGILGVVVWAANT